jgi:Leucine-rich repeat (LRR) protein
MSEGGLPPDEEPPEPPGIQLAFTKRGFTSIPDSVRRIIFEVGAVERLAFSGNAIPEVPSDILALPSLRRLNLFSNRVQEISSETSAITNLDVGANSLSRLPEGFPELLALNADWNEIESIEFAYPKVSRLCLSANRLRFFRSDLVFPELRILDISRNSVRELPNLALFCPQLTRLDASRNEIREFPVLSENLHFLDLSNNRIRVIPIGIEDSKLAQLDLSSNLIESVPDMPVSLRSLSLDGNVISRVQCIEAPTLSRLSFSRNRLASFPGFVSVKVRELNLDHNCFEILEMSECSQVVGRIDLSFNAILDLPFELFMLPNLRSLDLSFNRIERLPDGISGPSLLCLNLSRNPLKELPPELPATLERLIICDCRLSMIPDSYTTLQELIELDASMNSISVLPEFQNLEHLNMANNLLSAFPSVNLDSLQHLDVSCNHIRVMPAVVICPRAQFIDLSYNEIVRLGRLECRLISSLRLTGNPLKVTENAPLVTCLLSDNRLGKLRLLDVSNTPLAAPPGEVLCVAAWQFPDDIGYAQLRGRMEKWEDQVVAKGIEGPRILGFFHADDAAFAAAAGFVGDETELEGLTFADDGESAMLFAKSRSVFGYVRGNAKLLIVEDNGRVRVVGAETPLCPETAGAVIALRIAFQTHRVRFVLESNVRYLILTSGDVLKSVDIDLIGEIALRPFSPPVLARYIIGIAAARGSPSNLTVIAYRVQ